MEAEGTYYYNHSLETHDSSYIVTNWWNTYTMIHPVGLLSRCFGLSQNKLIIMSSCSIIFHRHAMNEPFYRSCFLQCGAPQL